MTLPDPTERELEILKILWRRREATVREVYEELRESLPIVQNTVQAFLRTMEEKGLVEHRTVGRTFVYTPVIPREAATRKLLSGLLDRVFDGAIDQFVYPPLLFRFEFQFQDQPDFGCFLGIEKVEVQGNLQI